MDIHRIGYEASRLMDRMLRRPQAAEARRYWWRRGTWLRGNLRTSLRWRIGKWRRLMHFITPPTGTNRSASSTWCERCRISAAGDGNIRFLKHIGAHCSWRGSSKRVRMERAKSLLSGTHLPDSCSVAAIQGIYQCTRFLVVVFVEVPVILPRRNIDGRNCRLDADAAHMRPRGER